MRLGDGGISAAELVIADDAAPLGKLGIGLHVMPGRTRAAVQAKQRQLAGGFCAADDLVPGLMACKRNETLFGRRIVVHETPIPNYAVRREIALHNVRCRS